MESISLGVVVIIRRGLRRTDIEGEENVIVFLYLKIASNNDNTNKILTVKNHFQYFVKLLILYSIII